MNRFTRSETAATAAEFALVLPIALIFFFGIIDTGRYMWDVNQVEKAVQVGARVAVTTNAVVGGLDDADFGTACGGLEIGDTIDCTDAMPPITCSATACSAQDGDCGPVDCDTFRAPAFNNIFTRINRIAPFVSPQQVSVTYSAAGLGYYGDPACFGERTKAAGGCDTGELPDIAPLTTVTIAGAPFRPTILAFADIGMRLPTRSYSLTLEDGRGTFAY